MERVVSRWRRAAIPSFAGSLLRRKTKSLSSHLSRRSSSATIRSAFASAVSWRNWRGIQTRLQTAASIFNWKRTLLRLDPFCVSQQPNELHNTMRAQFTDVVSFVQCEDRALEWLCAYGFQEPELRGFQPGQFIARRRGSLGETRGKVF